VNRCIRIKPLRLVSKGVNLLLTLVGLANLTDSMVDWAALVRVVLDQYQSLVYPVFKLLFEWLPCEMPTLVWDYIFVGLIVAGSYARAQSMYTWTWDSTRKAVVSFLFWPMLFVRMFQYWWLMSRLKSGRFPQKMRVDTSDWVLNHMSEYLAEFWAWLGALVLAFVVLLVVNAGLANG
jgi:hypothetical protein